MSQDSNIPMFLHLEVFVPIVRSLDLWSENIYSLQGHNSRYVSHLFHSHPNPPSPFIPIVFCLLVYLEHILKGGYDAHDQVSAYHSLIMARAGWSLSLPPHFMKVMNRTCSWSLFCLSLFPNNGVSKFSCSIFHICPPSLSWSHCISLMASHTFDSLIDLVIWISAALGFLRVSLCSCLVMIYFSVIPCASYPCATAVPPTPHYRRPPSNSLGELTTLQVWLESRLLVYSFALLCKFTSSICFYLYSFSQLLRAWDWNPTVFEREMIWQPDPFHLINSSLMIATAPRHYPLLPRFMKVWSAPRVSGSGYLYSHIFAFSRFFCTIVHVLQSSFRHPITYSLLPIGTLSSSNPSVFSVLHLLYQASHCPRYAHSLIELKLWYRAIGFFALVSLVIKISNCH